MASSAFAEGPASAVPILGASIGTGLDTLGDSSSLVAWSLSESLYASAQEHEHSVGHKSAVSWGAKSSQGGRTSQEDAYCVQESLSPPASRSLADTGSPSPPHHPSSIDGDQPSGQPQQQQGSGAAFQQWDGNQSLSLPFLPEDLTFFGVYDGHGGQEVAQHCSEHLHRHFAEHISMARFESTCSLRRSGSGASAASSNEGQQLREEGAKAQEQADALAPQGSLGSPTAVSSMCAEGSLTSDGGNATTAMASGAQALSPAASADAGRAGRFIKDALRQAFAKTDADLAGTDVGEFVGATAVVAVMAREHIYIAHCGDSRAVVQRGGEATPVTRDHKPDREDEMERVRAAGGKVVFNSGSYRVMGMLAMSRAIGDHFLRPYVIAEPEITVLERTPEDEILVIATDGLWDVFSSQEAAGLASRCIQRSKERGMTGHGACRVAASVLTRVAIARGSRDNITVIVVDISEPPRQVEASEASKDKCAVPNSAQGPGAISKNGSFSLGTYCWLKSQQQAGQGGKSGADDRHYGSQSSAPASENQRQNAGTSGAAAAYAHARARLAAARARSMARAASAAVAATPTSVSGCSVLGRRSRSAMEEGGFGGARDGANSPAMHQQQQHCQQLDELQQHLVDASQLAKAMRHAYSCRYPPHSCSMLPVGSGGMHSELVPSVCVAEPAACWSAVDTARTMAV